MLRLLCVNMQLYCTSRPFWLKCVFLVVCHRSFCHRRSLLLTGSAALTVNTANLPQTSLCCPAEPN